MSGRRLTLRAASRQGQRGLGAIAAVVVLVMLAVLAAAVVKLGYSQQIDTAQDVLGARALHAASAGTDWGLYQAFKGSWTSCAGSSQTLDLTSDTGFYVTVSCSSTQYNDGESVPGTAKTVRVYVIDAIACNGSGACPDSTRSTAVGYVERRRQVLATDAAP